MNETTQTITVALWVAAFVTVCSVIAVRPKPRKNSIPDDAAAIGPDNYMRVWESDGRISMAFRNVPGLVVKFDNRAAGDLAKWLENCTTQTGNVEKPFPDCQHTLQ